MQEALHLVTAKKCVDKNTLSRALPVIHVRYTVYSFAWKISLAKTKGGWAVLAKRNTQASPNDADIVRRILSTTNRDIRCSRCEAERYASTRRFHLQHKSREHYERNGIRMRRKGTENAKENALVDARWSSRKKSAPLRCKPIAATSCNRVYTQTSTYCRQRFFVNIVVEYRASFVRTKYARVSTRILKQQNL